MPLLPALPSVARRLNPFLIVYGMKCDAAQSIVAFDQLTGFDETALPKANPGSEPWVYCTLKTSDASTPLLVSVSYRIQPTIDVLPASRLADDYFRFAASPNRLIEARENDTNIVVAEIFESSLPNSSDPPISIGLPVAALLPAPYRYQPFLAPSAMAPAIVPLSVHLFLVLLSSLPRLLCLLVLAS